jgi:ACS family tartrate transporter-like MFS transporter
MTSAVVSAIEKSTMRVVARRIVPLMLLLYVCAYLDRVSLSYAQLKMGEDLGIDPALFGFAASMFFAGYFLFEIPSNALLYRLGARIWLTRIGVTWGLVTIATGFVQNETQLVIARVLLGIAEAGLAPGVLFYMASFFPAAYKGRATALFFLGSPLAGVIAGPIAGVVIDNVTWGGLESWRWVFILFGIPAVIVGVLLALLITNRVEDARWLSAEQREWLAERIRTEQGATEEQDAQQRGGKHNGLWSALKDKRALLLALFNFCATSGVNGLVFFIPLIIKGIAASGTSVSVVSFLSTLPFILGCIGMAGVAWSSDRLGERPWHLAATLLIGAVGLVVLPMTTGNPVVGMVILCVVTFGTFGYAGPSFAMAQQQFVGKRSAIGIAVVTSGAALAGLVAPWLFGVLTQATGNTNAGVYYLAGSLLVGGVVAVLTRKMWINVDARRGPVDGPAQAAEPTAEAGR